jgi:hypothetical protein
LPFPLSSLHLLTPLNASGTDADLCTDPFKCLFVHM